MADKILLVEDEPINLKILSTYLRNAHYQIEEAQDGEAALKKLSADPNYALVVTDRRMPKMDGIELFTAMQRNARLKQIPVIMQTVADTPSEVVDGIRAGVYYYLTKPYEEETLLSLVQAAIRDQTQTNLFEERLSKQREALDTLERGEFKLRTPDEAENIAFLLGGLFPRPQQAATGLYELLLNAIEHGNLGIGYDSKGKLLADGSFNDEVKTRLVNPANQNKFVTVQFARVQDRYEVIISDEGIGFDWRPFLEIEPARATQNHGRGVAKANLLSFDRLTFLGKGNQVHVVSNAA